MIDLPKHKHIIVFDGVCNLCNSSVKFVIKYDKKNQFVFTPLQSKTGKYIIDLQKIDITNIDSIILYHANQKVYFKSTAALRIAYLLGFPNSLFAVLLIIPAFIRNYVYDYIAKNRFKWFGKKDACMIPTPELKNKFLD